MAFLVCEKTKEEGSRVLEIFLLVRANFLF